MFLQTTKPFTQYSPLDVNLSVDRAANTVEGLEVTIDIPTNIKFGEEAVLTIKDFNPSFTYRVSVKYGTVRIEDDLIYYRAPPAPKDDVDILEVNVYVPPMGISYFPDTTGAGKDFYYDSSGTIHYVSDALSDPSVSPNLKAYLEDLRDNIDDVLNDKESQVPPIRMEHYEYAENNTLNGEDFSIEETFAEYKHLERSWKDDGAVEGGFDNYHLPSDIDLKDNPLPNMYVQRRADGSLVFGWKSRNANTNEASGNVKDGYRFPGAVGSSLTVTKSEDKTDKSFFFPIEIGLYPLEAIVPPEILSLCIQTVEIVPILKGIPDGHTFLWEQIKGDVSEVTWISDPTDKDLIINIGKIKTDRVFRFWISKGTKYEKYYDVIIYGTPKEEMSGLPNAGNFNALTGANLNSSNHNTRPILLTAERLWVKEFRVKFRDKIR